MSYHKTGYRHKKAYTRDAKMSHVEWAEENVIFADSSLSPIPGKLKLKYSAHLRMPFDKLDIPKTKSVVAKFASQSGKSLLTTIAVGKRLDTDPAFVLLMLPTKDALPKLMKTSINPNLKSIPKLWRKFEDYKSDESIRNKDTVKLLAGGGLVITGSTVGERKSLTVPMVVFDEVAEMESGTVQEASERMKSYSSFFPKSLAVSTIVSPTDEICTAYDACECKLEYMFKCPNCEEPFLPSSKTFSFITKKEYAEEVGIKEDDINQQDLIRKSIETAHIACPSCAYKIYQDERKAMIFDGRGMGWVAVDGDAETATSFGFSMNTMASYFVPMSEFVQEIFKCGDDEIKLDKLYRGWWSEWFESNQENKTSPKDILVTENGIGEWVVPDDTIAIYAATDVQSDHFWIKITAFTYNNVAHVIYAGRLEEYKQLVDIMERTYYKVDGSVYNQGIRRMFIDLGGYVKVETAFSEETKKMEQETVIDKTQETRDFIYEFSDYFGKAGEYDRVIGVKGSQFIAGDEPYAWTRTRLTKNNYQDTREIKSLSANTTALKLNSMQRLYRTIEKEQATELDVAYDNKYRLEYINQDMADKIKNAETINMDSYIHQMTSEVYKYPKDKRGNVKDRKTFVQIKKDNHFLDCSMMIELGYLLDNLQTIKKPIYGVDKSKMFSVTRGLL